MPRKYMGLDCHKVSVRLDKEVQQIVGQYCGDNAVTPSEAIRTALKWMGATKEMSDIIETSCANLLDIATVFEKIEGPNSPIYAEALREAAIVLWALNYTKEDFRDL